MRTSPLPTVRVSVATTRCQYQGVGPQVNKCEQISSDDHQMSVTGGGGSRCPGLMSIWGKGGGRCPGRMSGGGEGE